MRIRFKNRYMKRIFKYLCTCNGALTSKKEKFGAFFVGYGTVKVIHYFFPNFLLFILYYFLAITAEMLIWAVLQKILKKRFNKKVE